MDWVATASETSVGPAGTFPHGGPLLSRVLTNVVPRGSGEALPGASGCRAPRWFRGKEPHGPGVVPRAGSSARSDLYELARNRNLVVDLGIVAVDVHVVAGCAGHQDQRGAAPLDVRSRSLAEGKCDSRENWRRSANRAIVGDRCLKLVLCPLRLRAAGVARGAAVTHGGYARIEHSHLAVDGWNRYWQHSLVGLPGRLSPAA